MFVQMITKRWIQTAVLLLLLGFAIAAQLKEPWVVKVIHNITFDELNSAWPREPLGNHTLIVDIDEESLRRIGQWPWPHTLIGEIPLKLRELGAKAVIFDMTFAEPDRTSPDHVAQNIEKMYPGLQDVTGKLRALPDNDTVFAQEIAKAGNVVMGFVAAGEDATQRLPAVNQDMFLNAPPPGLNRKHYFVPSLPVLEKAAAGNGIFTSEPDFDGVIREVPLLLGHAESLRGPIDAMYPALSLEALRVTMSSQAKIRVETDHGTVSGIRMRAYDGSGGQTYLVKTNDEAKIRVYYSHHEDNKANGLYLPAWQLFEKGLVPPERVKDKFVFIGTSAIGLLDIRSSPLNITVPGVEIHTQIIEQILAQKFLLRGTPEKSVEFFLTGLIGLLIIVIAPFISAGTLALAVAGLLGVLWGGTVYAYLHTGNLFDPLYPSLVLTGIFIFASILANLRTELEKRQIRLAFGHYISPVLIEELAKNPEKLKLGGEVRELTVMFTDIRNFTSISETMDPAELIRMMNDFLTPMTSAVLDNRGTVDKYMGDAMMTFWNAPLDDPLHAQNACKASLEMVKALGPVNDELRLRAEKAGRKFLELKAGIGIHSGKASVGNMGSRQRFAYSALGDTVNLASRLEGQTKAYGIGIMISQATRGHVADYAAIEIDLLAVKGRAEAERVYALLGDPALAQDEAFKGFAARHGEMLAAYRAQDWAGAERLAGDCVQQRPELATLYELYKTRINAYRKEPPPAGWKGAWVAKDK
jgi:adenylate cyclase